MERAQTTAKEMFDKYMELTGFDKMELSETQHKEIKKSFYAGIGSVVKLLRNPSFDHFQTMFIVHRLEKDIGEHFKKEIEDSLPKN